MKDRNIVGSDQVEADVEPDETMVDTKPEIPPEIAARQAKWLETHDAPYVKPTNEEIQERVALCRMLLSQGRRDSYIRRAFRKKFSVHWRTTDGYLVRARAEMVSDLDRSKAELISESYETYLAIVSADDSTYGERTQAQKQIDRILGLHAPIKVAQTDVDGNSPSREDDIALIQELTTKLQRNRAGVVGDIIDGVMDSSN